MDDTRTILEKAIEIATSAMETPKKDAMLIYPMLDHLKKTLQRGLEQCQTQHS